MTTKVIDVCGEGLCMNTAAHLVSITVRWNRRRATTSVVGKLCDRHIEVLRLHAAKRMGEDARLSVMVTATKIGGA